MTPICRHAVLPLLLLGGGIAPAQDKPASPPQADRAVSDEQIAKVGSLTYAQLEAAFEAARKKDPEAAEDSPAFQRLMLAEAARAQAAQLPALLQPSDSGSTGPRPTKEEAALLFTHPSKVRISVRAFQMTVDDMEKVFGGQPRDGTAANAVKHAYWNALLTKYSDTKWALLLTTAHETDALKEKPDHSFMDLHNNGVGRKVASRNKNASEKELLAEIRKLPHEFIDVKGKSNKEVRAEMEKARGLVHIVKGGKR